MTRAPALMSRRAKAYPNPDVAPVISATRPTAHCSARFKIHLSDGLENRTRRGVPDQSFDDPPRQILRRQASAAGRNITVDDHCSMLGA
jgi:hypothetical protein